jgi:DNA mismatch endonuclease (patch repair protein)
MSAPTRSALMSRIRGKDTGPERCLVEYLTARGLVFERHANDLPGRPDIVFRDARVAVFIDGDFWHGWRFPLWRGKLTPFWQEKIEGNRQRDRRNFRRLRVAGWRVVGIWEHQVEQDLSRCGSYLCSILMSRIKCSDRREDRPAAIDFADGQAAPRAATRRATKRSQNRGSRRFPVPLHV